MTSWTRPYRPSTTASPSPTTADPAGANSLSPNRRRSTPIGPRAAAEVNAALNDPIDWKVAGRWASLTTVASCPTYSVSDWVSSVTELGHWRLTIWLWKVTAAAVRGFVALEAWLAVAPDGSLPRAFSALVSADSKAAASAVKCCGDEGLVVGVVAWTPIPGVLPFVSAPRAEAAPVLDLLAWAILPADEPSLIAVPPGPWAVSAPVSPVVDVLPPPSPLAAPPTALEAFVD